MARMVEVVCTQCGKRFSRIAGNANAHPNTFCSRECQSAYSFKRVTRVCKACGKEYETISSRNAKYCSKECEHIGRRKRSVFVCETCGKEFEAITKSNPKFCSRACRRNGVTIPCRQCGKPTYQRPSDIKANTGGKFFCDMACQRAWEATKKIGVVCKECCKEFERYKHHAGRQEDQFCSAKCHGAWQGRQRHGENHPRWVSELAVTCDNCGKDFRQRGTARLERNQHNFCCTECFNAWAVENEIHVGEKNPNWHGGQIDYYGPNWYRQARLARKRDHYECRHCGKNQKKARRTLDVHHMIPFRNFGYVRGQNDNYLQANHLDNLITLCQQCHAKAEARMIAIQPTLLSA